MNKYGFCGERPLRTIRGTNVANDFVRIVHGGRGVYVEIDDKDILKEALIPVSARHIYYTEFRTGYDGIKFYYQLRTVAYADYRIGLWYVSPIDLQGFKIVGRYKTGEPTDK